MNLKNKTLNQIKLYYVYKLTKNGLGSRDTTKQINNKFFKIFNKKIINEREVIDICNQYSIVRKGFSKKYKYYEKDFEKKLAIKLYTEFYNTQKVILYMKKRHNMDFTEQQLRILAHNVGKKKILRQNNVTGSKFTYLEEKQIVKEYLEGATLQSLAKKYDYKNHVSIIEKLEKYNIPRRTKKEIYNKNKTYKDFTFKEIDCDWKGYFLGLLLTDGCIQHNRVGIGLIDEDAIKFLSKKINVKYSKREYMHNEKRKTMYGIGIYSNEIIEDIKRYGLVENKTHTLQPPKLKNDEIKYLPYIFKGIIDGDGWIRKDGKAFNIASASKDFIYWCKDILENYFGMEKVNVTKKYDNFYILHSAKQKNIEILKNKIYISDMGMKRKYNKVHNL